MTFDSTIINKFSINFLCSIYFIFVIKFKNCYIFKILQINTLFDFLFLIYLHINNIINKLPVFLKSFFYLNSIIYKVILILNFIINFTIFFSTIFSILLLLFKVTLFNFYEL